MQSKTLLLFIAIASLFSCTRGHFYEHQRLTALPAQEHSRPIDIYFENQEEPAKDYVEFYDLRLVKRGNFNDRQMVDFLQKEARKKGLDAVTSLRKWDESEETISLFDAIATATDESGVEYTSMTNYSIIEGKGIKYIENIDLSQSIKTGTVVNLNTGEEVGKINYLPNGLISETESNNPDAKILLDTYFKLSEDRMLYEEKGWQTLHHADGKIDVRRKYRMNDWLLERVRVRFDHQNNRIKTIRLTESPKQHEVITRVLYTYDKSGRLTERKAVGASLMKETLNYYEDGTLNGLTIEFGGSVYRIDLSYYQQSDLNSLIKRVEVVE